MQKNEAIYWYGSQVKLAEFLGVPQSNVSIWDEVPRRHQLKIEKDTQGELKADPPKELIKYSFVIEKKYLDMIAEIADKQKCSKMKVIRDIIKYYHKKFIY